jgi:hypothetical protein
MTIILLLVGIAALMFWFVFELMFMDFTVNEIYHMLKRHDAERDAALSLKEKGG